MWPKGYTVWTHTYVCVLGFFFFFFKLQHIMSGGMKVEMAEMENKKGGDPYSVEVTRQDVQREKANEKVKSYRERRDSRKVRK